MGRDRAVVAALPAEAERLQAAGCRLPISDRVALIGNLFVLRTGLPWEYLSVEMGYGSGMSCWRRLRERQQACVWAALHRGLLERLESAGHLDWRRTTSDSTSAAARGATRSSPTNPTHRGKPGTKRHLIVDARVASHGLTLTGANRHDSMALAATLDASPRARSSRPSRPRRRPTKLHADDLPP